MIIVTKDNVTKLSENALYLHLDSLDPSNGLALIIEAELDRRLELNERLMKRRHQQEMDNLKLNQAIQTEIHQIFEGYKGKKTLFLIENLGQEYIDDYVICDVTFTVTSLVAENFNSNATSEHFFDTIEKARAKKAKLIYDRIYNKFMRNATSDNLELLKRLLGGSDVSNVITHDFGFRKC